MKAPIGLLVIGTLTIAIVALAAPPLPCGDGQIDPDEACDDGNVISGDGCDADCTLSIECSDYDPGGAPNELFVGGCGAPTFATINAAIAAAQEGDVVSVCPGTYAESVVISKAVKLRSTGGAAVTTIQAPGIGMSIRLSGTTVEGFTVQASATAIDANQICPLGQATCVSPGERGSNVTVTDNVIENSAVGIGWHGKIDCVSVTDNDLGDNGRHIELVQTVLTNVPSVLVKVAGNSANSGGADGPAVAVYGMVATLEANGIHDAAGIGLRIGGAKVIVAGGTVERSGAAGIVVDAAGVGTQIVENEIRDNTGDGITIGVGGEVTRVQNNNIRGNGVGLGNEAATGAVDATENWWDSQTGPSGLSTGTGDSIVNRGGATTTFAEYLCKPFPQGFPSLNGVCSGEIAELRMLYAGRKPDIDPTGGYITFESDKDMNVDPRTTASNPDGSQEIYLIDRSPATGVCLDGACPGCGPCTGDNQCVGQPTANPTVLDGACVMVTQITDDAPPIGSAKPRLSIRGNDVVFTSTSNSTNGNADGSLELFSWDRRAFEKGVSPLTMESNGASGDSYDNPAVSRRGTYVVVESDGNPIGTNSDSNREIFAFKTGNRQWIQISNTLSPVENHRPVTVDGRHILFDSNGNFTGQNPDGNREVFLANLKKGVTFTQITNTTLPAENISGSLDVKGNFIAFTSDGNITGQNADGNREVFTWVNGVFEQITDSLPSDCRTECAPQPECQLACGNVKPMIDPLGRFIVFETTEDLIGDGADNRRVVMHNRATGERSLLSKSRYGDNSSARISSGGDFVVWDSTANLTGKNAGGDRVIYLYDRKKDSVLPGNCGNNIVEPGEACDDGNSRSGDCCSSTCQTENLGTIVCGSGVCQRSVQKCLGGFLQTCVAGSPGTEGPPGNGSCSNGLDDDCDRSSDGADSSCGPVCNSNGITDPGEQCDQGAANSSNNSCCTTSCRYRPAGQICRSSTDTCDASEACSGISAICPADFNTCGTCDNDGSKDPGEACDGNDLGGATCQDQGFQCGALACNTDCVLDSGGCGMHTCSPQGAMRCLGGAEERCGDYSGNDCWEWGDRQPCPDGCGINSCSTSLDLSVRAIVPIQILEDAPLVQNKHAMVRVYLEASGIMPNTPVLVTMRLVRGALSFDQPVYLVQAQDRLFIIEPAVLFVYKSCVARGCNLNGLAAVHGWDAVNFGRSGQIWQPTGPTETLSATIDLDNAVEELNESNNSLTTVSSVSDLRSQAYNVLIQRLRIKTFGGLRTYDFNALAADSDFDTFAQRQWETTVSLFPVVTSSARSIAAIDTRTCLLAGCMSPGMLRSLAVWSGAGNWDRVVYVVPNGALNSDEGGIASPLAPLVVLVDENADSFTVAHELAHTYGLKDEVKPTGTLASVIDAVKRQFGIGTCGLDQKTYFYGNMAGKGWDVLGVSQSKPKINAEPFNFGSPYNNYSLMGIATSAWAPSYEGTCNPYSDLMAAFLPTPALKASASNYRSLAALASNDEVFIVAGEASSEHCILDPIVDSMGNVSVSSGGSIEVRVLDGDDVILSTYQVGTPDGEVALSFVAMLPYAADAERIALVRDGVECAERLKSPASPVVTVSTATANAPLLQVDYAMSDADSDASLTGQLFYSSDGVRWLPLLDPILDLQGSVAIDGADLPGGISVIRFVATDGFNTGRSDSAPFMLPNRAPTVRVISPRAGQVLLAAPAVLYAGVSEPEGEPVVVSWSTDVGNVSGGGNPFSTMLTAGTGTLTVTASDPVGNVSSNTIPLFVSAAEPGGIDVRAGRLGRESLVIRGTAYGDVGALGSPDQVSGGVVLFVDQERTAEIRWLAGEMVSKGNGRYKLHRVEPNGNRTNVIVSKYGSDGFLFKVRMRGSGVAGVGMVQAREGGRMVVQMDTTYFQRELILQPEKAGYRLAAQ